MKCLTSGIYALSSSLHRNACIFFKKTYSPTSRLVCLPQKRATRCCCGEFLLGFRHAAEIFRGGEPAPQPKDFHDQRPRNPSDRVPEFRRTEPEAFKTQDPRLCPRKDGYCLSNSGQNGRKNSASFPRFQDFSQSFPIIRQYGFRTKICQAQNRQKHNG